MQLEYLRHVVTYLTGYFEQYRLHLKTYLTCIVQLYWNYSDT